METMSRPTLQLALGGLLLCAIGGFWLGLQGALPREGSAGPADVNSPALETAAPNAYRTPLDAEPYSDIAVSEAPAASEAAATSEAEVQEAPKPAPPTTPKPAPPPVVAPAASATPAPSAAPPAPAPASATPPPEEDLPPY